MKLLRQSLLVTALMLSAAAGSFARADSSAPDVSLTSKAVHVTVVLDSEIKSIPALSAHLLNEAKEWAQRNFDNTQRDAKKNPAAYSNGWNYNRNYSVAAKMNDRYLSILMAETRSTDAPFPLSGFKGYLWDKQDGKMIDLQAFFSDLQDNGQALTTIRDTIIKELAAERKQRDHEDPQDPKWQRDILPTLAGIGDIIFEPSTEAGKSSGLVAIYEPYMFGPEFEEEYVAFIPWQSLAPFLNDLGKSIFAGTRPSIDEAVSK